MFETSMSWNFCGSWQSRETCALKRCPSLVQRLFLFSMFVSLASLLCIVLPLHAQSSEERSFKDLLSSNIPIKSMRFSEIDCKSGNQRHYVAAVDTNGFFLREYNLDEDPLSLISTDNVPQISDFYGQNGNVCWNIDAALEINESDKSDTTASFCQLGARTSKALIETILNLGVSGLFAQRGSFVWNETNSTLFFFRPPAGVTVKRVKDGLILTNLPGSIDIENGFVVKMSLYAHGVVACYEYATNSHVPFGIPTKIIQGVSVSQCRKIYLLEELQYKQPDDPAISFNPEAKFFSTNVATIVLITNGTRRVLYTASQRLIPPLLNSSTDRVQKNQSLARSLVMAVILITPVLLFCILRRKTVDK
jgi:hypothetical protein